MGNSCGFISSVFMLRGSFSENNLDKTHDRCGNWIQANDSSNNDDLVFDVHVMYREHQFALGYIKHLSISELLLHNSYLNFLR